MNIDELMPKLLKISKSYQKEFDITFDEKDLLLKMQEELGELTQSFLSYRGIGRSRGKSKDEMKLELENELADVFCMLLLFNDQMEIDLEGAIKRKWLKWLDR